VTNYYNEIDPNAAAWLRELIRQGHLPDGHVDERDIRDVRPDDLRTYTQCHFFAGIGGWSLALRLAGWPADRPVWTGSCPCQPFSAAGRRAGAADERHLWPHWHHLIRECRPPEVFGEQVASKDGLGWLDLVSADLEGEGYAVGAADLCAAGVGAPHIRQRLWFYAGDERLADADGKQRHEGLQPLPRRSSERPWSDCKPLLGLADADEQGSRGRGIQRPEQGDGAGAGSARQRSAGLRADGGLADADSGQRDRITGGERRQPNGAEAGRVQGDSEPERGVTDRRLADASADGSQGRLSGRQDQGREAINGSAGRDGADRRPSPTDSFWRDADWLFCRDGKCRPVEPGTFPLAHGLPARVGRLRGYGNAIVPQVAAAFIEAIVDTQRDATFLESGKTTGGDT